MDTNEKLSDLKKLGDKRRNDIPSKVEKGACNLADIGNATVSFETEFVSPYTKTAGNVDSKIFIILQDWASRASITKEWLDTDEAQCCAKLGYSEQMKTNVNLASLLTETFQLNIADVFITNLFPFIKAGGISGGISMRALGYCWSEYCLPQIQMVRPRLVICAGTRVTAAITAALGADSIQRGKSLKYDGATYFHQYHPAARVSIERQKELWGGMRNHAAPDK